MRSIAITVIITTVSSMILFVLGLFTYGNFIDLILPKIETVKYSATDMSQAFNQSLYFWGDPCINSSGNDFRLENNTNYNDQKKVADDLYFASVYAAVYRNPTGNDKIAGERLKPFIHIAIWVCHTVFFSQL